MSNAPVYLQAKEGDTLTPEEVDRKTKEGFDRVTSNIATLSKRMDATETWQGESDKKFGKMFATLSRIEGIVSTHAELDEERRTNASKQIRDIEDCLYDVGGNPGVKTRLDRVIQQMKLVIFIGGAFALALISIIVKVLSGT